jgi:HSP20 family protein
MHNRQSSHFAVQSPLQAPHLEPVSPREPHPFFAVVEDEHEVDVFADLPGLSGGEVSVRCENGVLYISGGKVGVTEEKVAGHFRSRENWAELFSRSLELGDHMDWNHADASLKDGVLTVRLPKSAISARPRIEIPVH